MFIEELKVKDRKKESEILILKQFSIVKMIIKDFPNLSMEIALSFSVCRFVLK